MESMCEALKAVKLQGKGLRQAARDFDVPVTTLKRRVDGTVPVNAKPGPATVLTMEEEEKLCKYCFDMCDMGCKECGISYCSEFWQATPIS